MRAIRSRVHSPSGVVSCLVARESRKRDCKILCVKNGAFTRSIVLTSPKTNHPSFIITLALCNCYCWLVLVVIMRKKRKYPPTFYFFFLCPNCRRYFCGSAFSVSRKTGNEMKKEKNSTMPKSTTAESFQKISDSRAHSCEEDMRKC